MKKAWRALEFRQLGMVTIEKNTEIIQGSKERVHGGCHSGCQEEGGR